MQTVSGFVTAVQEGRFRLVSDDGRVRQFVLSHKSSAEPQDLPGLQASGARVRVEYSDSPRLIAAIAERIDIEEARA